MRIDVVLGGLWAHSAFAHPRVQDGDTFPNGVLDGVDIVQAARLAEDSLPDFQKPETRMFASTTTTTTSKPPSGLGAILVPLINMIPVAGPYLGVFASGAFEGLNSMASAADAEEAASLLATGQPFAPYPYASYAPYAPYAPYPVPSMAPDPFAPVPRPQGELIPMAPFTPAWTQAEQTLATGYFSDALATQMITDAVGAPAPTGRRPSAQELSSMFSAEVARQSASGTPRPTLRDARASSSYVNSVISVALSRSRAAAGVVTAAPTPSSAKPKTTAISDIDVSAIISEALAKSRASAAAASAASGGAGGSSAAAASSATENSVVSSAATHSPEPMSSEAPAVVAPVPAPVPTSASSAHSEVSPTPSPSRAKVPTLRPPGISPMPMASSSVKKPPTSSSRAIPPISIPRPRPSMPGGMSPPRPRPSSSAGAAPIPAGPEFTLLPEPVTNAAEKVKAWDRRARTHSFQIILSGTPDIKPSASSVTPNVDIYDVDLFMTDKSTIQTLHRLNKTVICYFSGGTYEPGRPDSKLFASADMGQRLKEWPSEKWLRLSSAGVRRIMADRIQLSYQKGCDAIDPDNVDAHQERGGGGLGLSKRDSVSFVKFLSQTAARYGMATGLKNAMDTIPEIKPHVNFAVNEECAVRKECKQYTGFAKPVYHIEYPPLQLYLSVPAFERTRYCVDNEIGLKSYFHTVMKAKKLDGGVEYCDGVYAKTPTREIQEGNGRNRPGKSSRPAKYVKEDYGNQGTMDSFKAWQFDDAMIQHQANLAEEDGYPFLPGQGSDRYISDNDLESYELEAPLSPEPYPVAPEPQLNQNIPAAPADGSMLLPDQRYPSR